MNYLLCRRLMMVMMIIIPGTDPSGPSVQVKEYMSNEASMRLVALSTFTCYSTGVVDDDDLHEYF